MGVAANQTCLQHNRSRPRGEYRPPVSLVHPLGERQVGRNASCTAVFASVAHGFRAFPNGKYNVCEFAVASPKP